MWAIAATMNVFDEGEFLRTDQVPTFFLDPRVSGIRTKEGAEQMALRILLMGVSQEGHVHFDVTAVKV